MAKNSNSYVCQSCGAITRQWAGRCTSCSSWNSIVEEIGENSGIAGGPVKEISKGRLVLLESLDQDREEPPRIPTGIGELDRVCGGGLVPGSATLVGGEPGIGKSTLLLQVACFVANDGGQAVYFSGEEATAQIRLRAKRLDVTKAPVGLAAETNISNILSTLKKNDAPNLVIIDSVQTLWTDSIDAAPGTVSQVRACSQALIRYAKKSGCCLVMVGHVTKDGQIAGPKVIEHMVDTVLYFEGDSGHQFRILRAVKNRFGATDEIGVFEMLGSGLAEIENPSELFLGERSDNSPGAAVFAGVEGTRPVLVEIQALVAPSTFAAPRRSVVGWDKNRLSMILAVLEARCGLRFGGHDVYLNIAGGLRISEPAADLAVASALISSLSGIALSTKCVYFGEVSLSGAVRSVGHMSSRLKEAQKLGFKLAEIPEAGKKEGRSSGLECRYRSHLSALTEGLLVKGGQDKENSRRE